LESPGEKQAALPFALRLSAIELFVGPTKIIGRGKHITKPSLLGNPLGHREQQSLGIRQPGSSFLGFALYSPRIATDDGAPAGIRGKGVTLIALRCAFFAQYPRGGFGTASLRQIFPSATSEIPSSRAAVRQGLDQMSSYSSCWVRVS